jgi:hypothetical protein
MKAIYRSNPCLTERVNSHLVCKVGRCPADEAHEGEMNARGTAYPVERALTWMTRSVNRRAPIRTRLFAESCSWEDETAEVSGDPRRMEGRMRPRVSAAAHRFRWKMSNVRQ